MPELMDFYFTSKGRISRKDFWLKGVLLLTAIVLVIYLIMMAILVAIGAVFGGLGGVIVGSVLAIPLYIGLIYAQVCVSAKRFHDRNMSGWWYLYFLLMALAAYAFVIGPIFLLGPESAIAGIFSAIGGIAYLGILIASLVILGFLPGTKGPNQYGSDPLDPTGGTASTFA